MALAHNIPMAITRSGMTKPCTSEPSSNPNIIRDAIMINLFIFHSPILAWHRFANQALNESTWIRRLPPRLPILIDGKSKSSAHCRMTAGATLANSAASSTVIHSLLLSIEPSLSIFHSLKGYLYLGVNTAI